MWASAMTWTSSPGTRSETAANICSNTAYCITFQPLAVSMSWLRWFSTALSTLPVTLKVTDQAQG